MRRKVEANVCNKPTSQSAYSSCVQPPRDRSSCSPRHRSNDTPLTLRFLLLFVLSYLSYDSYISSGRGRPARSFASSRRHVEKSRGDGRLVETDLAERARTGSYHLACFVRGSAFFSPAFPSGERHQADRVGCGSLESRGNGTQGGLEAGSTTRDTIANPERTRARAFVRAGYLKNKVAFAETGLLFTHIVRT